MNKEILILNSSLTTFKGKENEKDSTYNKVTFAYRDKKTSEKIIGFDKIKVCYLDPSSFQLTKDIKPYELIDAIVDFKEAKDGNFKITIVEINGVEV